MFNFIVEKDIYDQRMDECKSCEQYNSTTKTCSECKCVMPVKAKFAQFYCPLKKWDRDISKLIVQTEINE